MSERESAMVKKFKPIIKWSGSKRSQCDEIIEYFPKKIKTYYEPFIGGGSMMRRLLDSDVDVDKIVCSDLNGDLIALWNSIKNTPEQVFKTYKELWTEMNCTGKSIEEKKRFFEHQREIYNKTHDPNIFFFIMRTTTNGIPRYNSRGEFNNSFHITRNGIEPENLEPILKEWSELLNKRNVEFRHCSYEEILKKVDVGDFVYMDPPYFNTNGMYFGGIDFDMFFNELKKLNGCGVKFVLSFDGKSGDEDNTCLEINDIGLNHTYIKSGNSSFKRTIGKKNDAMVYESLYWNYVVECGGLW